MLISRLVACLLLLSCLAGCGEVTLVHDVNEKQGNQIVALLATSGIAATVEKASGGRGRYSVTVPKGLYSQAVRLITQNNLPEESELTFSELIQSRGLVPNSREIEALRVDHAISVELESVIKNYPAVRSVKALVRQSFAKDGGQPTVTLIVQTNTGLSVSREELLNILQKTVPGVKIENALISISEGVTPGSNVSIVGNISDGAQSLSVPLVPFLGFWYVSRDDYDALAVAVVICILGMGVVGVFIGYWFGSARPGKGMILSESLPMASRALKLDRGRKDLPEN